jgi:hypothetical protein
LLLDSAAASAGGTVLFQSNTWKDGNIVRFKGNTAHNGVFGAGIIKSSGSWFLGPSNASKTLHFECEDLEFDLTAIGDWNRTVLQWANSATDNFPLGNMTFRRCLVKGHNAIRNALTHELTVVSNSYSFTTRWENCVFSGPGSTSARFMDSTHTGSGGRTIEFVGCTQHECEWNGNRSGTGPLTVAYTGCLIDPYSTNAEFSTSGSGGTLSATSSYCITARTSAQHQSLFTSYANNTYSVTFVTGNPASGQVGYTDISGKDFSLYDDADNIAIDYVDAVMPADDIAGVSRPQGTLYDAGAFEVEAAAGVEVTPGVASLTSTAFTPTVVATDDKSVTPGVVATTTQRYTPTVTATDNKSAAPGLATLTSTSYPPTVAATADLTVTPGVVALTSTPRLPTVTATADVTVAPPTTTTTVTRYVSTVTATADVELTPGFASVTSTRYTPTVSITAGAEVFPAPATVTTSVFAPGVTVGFVIEPGTATLYFLGESASPGMLAPTTVASSAPTTVVTVGEWSDRVRLGPGDEWYVTLTGPSLPADAPQARVQLRFREYPS